MVTSAGGLSRTAEMKWNNGLRVCPKGRSGGCSPWIGDSVVSLYHGPTYTVCRGILSAVVASRVQVTRCSVLNADVQRLFFSLQRGSKLTAGAGKVCVCVGGGGGNKNID